MGKDLSCIGQLGANGKKKTTPSFQWAK